MTKLAALIGVEARSISAYEKGEYEPEEKKLTRLAEILRFPQAFFWGDDLEEPLADSASFRAMSKMTAAQRNSALGAGALALLLNHWIEQQFELPSADLPDLSREEDPEAAAASLRRYWGLGELPIKNIIHLLEAKGIRVFTLAVDTCEVDAFAMWHGSTPFIFLNTKKSAEHSRFDGGHELGHLVLHRHGSPQGQEAEREANAFASAFLMPRASVLARAPRFATINHLIKLKKIWGVSLSALTYRLHALQLLSDWHYRSLCIEIASRGYRKTEPEGMQRERSQVLAKVFAALRDEGFTKQDIANELHIPAEEIEKLVFGLTLTGLSGTPSTLTGIPRRRPSLQVVK